MDKSTQIGGDHYAKHKIQPWDIIDEYGLNFYAGNVLKYLLRYKDKGGVEDLRKAKHYLEKLIEVESKEAEMMKKELEELEKLIEKVESDKLKIDFAKGFYAIDSPEFGICKIAESYIDCCLNSLKRSYEELKNAKS